MDSPGKEPAQAQAQLKGRKAWRQEAILGGSYRSQAQVRQLPHSPVRGRKAEGGDSGYGVGRTWASCKASLRS